MNTMYPVWHQPYENFIAWQDRSNLPDEARDLSDDLMRDIGLSQASQPVRTTVPYWIS